MSNTVNRIDYFVNLLQHYDFILNGGGNVLVPPSWCLNDRIINEYHLLVTKYGSGNYYFEGKKEPLLPGKLIFISPGVCHSSELNIDDIPFIHSMRFSISHKVNKSLNPLRTPLAFGLQISNIPKYTNLYESLFSYYSNQKYSLSKILCNAVLTQIIGELLTDLSTPVQRKDHSIERVQKYIRENPQKRVNVDFLAQMAGLSKKHFTTLFKETCGLTPIQYQISARTQMAIYQLSESYLSIKEIADNLGYPDQYAFSKQFKLATGYSPSDYRKNRSAT